MFIDKEKIFTWNPDIIFIDSGGSELVKQDYIKKPVYKQMDNKFRKGY